jgi:hypothetical protein
MGEEGPSPWTLQLLLLESGLADDAELAIRKGAHVCHRLRR